jgi:hypothetical protein
MTRTARHRTWRPQNPDTSLVNFLTGLIPVILHSSLLAVLKAAWLCEWQTAGTSERIEARDMRDMLAAGGLHVPADGSHSLPVAGGATSYCCESVLLRS